MPNTPLAQKGTVSADTPNLGNTGADAAVWEGFGRKSEPRLARIAKLCGPLR
jgi:hypothetical protein